MNDTKEKFYLKIIDIIIGAAIVVVFLLILQRHTNILAF